MMQPHPPVEKLEFNFFEGTCHIWLKFSRQALLCAAILSVKAELIWPIKVKSSPWENLFQALNLLRSLPVSVIYCAVCQYRSIRKLRKPDDLKPFCLSIPFTKECLLKRERSRFFHSKTLHFSDDLSNQFMFVFSSHHLCLRVLEALGDEVDGLVLGDGVLLGRGHGRVERLHLGLVAQAVLELAEGAEKRN